MTLVNEVIICEKPQAAEKIANSLSSSTKKKKYKNVPYWEIKKTDKKILVVPAVGHLYTLAPSNKKKDYFFDLEWTPVYLVDKKRKYIKNYIDAIKKLGKKADRYIHACDYDIEGTLIGYNVLRYCIGKKSLKKSLRMKFSTLTKRDIRKAYENLTSIDYGQVNGGITRHFLDFLFGVNISRALMNSIQNSTKKFVKLSAGRVQTPTLSILVDREREIKKFKPKTYWVIEAKTKFFTAKFKEQKIFDKNKALKIVKECKNKNAIVKSVKITKKYRNPPVPFDLTTLQSEAYRLFGFSPRKTQSLAQNLYLGGYISYPRTSSQKLPPSIDYEKIFEGLSKNPKFERYISKLSKPFKPYEGKKTDEAHPAIHPTGVMPKNLNEDESKLYELIVHRFIAVFADKAKIANLRGVLSINDYEFIFNKQKIIKEGWMSFYPYTSVKNEEFPEIKEGDKLKIEKIIKEEKKTKPPARYTAASLIKEMEVRGLGTKSTRAEIISALYDRKYIEGRKIKVKPLGIKIINILKKYCKKITSEKLTREFEKKIKRIIKGEINKENVITEAKNEVKDILNSIEDKQKEIGEELYNAYKKSKIIGKCKCGGNLIIRYSQKYKKRFVGCSNYPACKVTYSLPKNAIILESKCKRCGLPLISYGNPRRVACLNPKCGKKIDEEKIVGKCPKCGNDLIIKSGRYGKFVGCKGFPKCKYVRPI